MLIKTDHYRRSYLLKKQIEKIETAVFAIKTNRKQTGKLNRTDLMLILILRHCLVRSAVKLHALGTSSRISKSSFLAYVQC